MSVSEARSPLRDEVSHSKCCIGSWMTTRSICRACTAGDRLSRPVLTAKQLDHPDRLSATAKKAPARGAIRWPHRFDPNDKWQMADDKCQMADDKWQMPDDSVTRQARQHGPLTAATALSTIL